MKEIGLIYSDFATFTELPAQMEAKKNAESPLVPRTKTGRIRWKKLSSNPKRLHEYIRFEAKQIVSEGFSLTHAGLAQSGNRHLARMTTKYYEGGVNQLKKDLGAAKARKETDALLPTGKSGRVLWTKLARKNPDRFSQAIRDKAREFINSGKKLTSRQLTLSGEGGFRKAIQNYYEDGLYGLQRDLGLRRKKLALTQDEIYNAAKLWVDDGQNLSYAVLRKSGRGDLAYTIMYSYEGAMAALKQRLGIKTNSPKEVFDRESFVAQAQAFIAEFGDISYSLLRQQGRHDLDHLSKKYSGGLRQFKVDNGLSLPKFADMDVDDIRKEAIEFLQEHGNLTTKILRTTKRYDLESIVRNKYPGGIAALRRDIGVSRRNNRNVWTGEFIEAEARRFLEEHGRLSLHLIKQMKRFDLGMAISTSYEGGMRALKAKLGIQQEFRTLGYWTEEKILEESIAIVEEHGQISYTFLRKLGRGDLGRAIGKHFPGGYRGLRERVGLQNHYKTEGFWTPESIEEAARAFYSNTGELSHNALLRDNNSALASAISRLYEGGMKALKEKVIPKQESFAEIIKAYEVHLETGESVLFSEFLKGINSG